MENPYAPPQTESAQRNVERKPWPILLAVLIGLVVDIAATAIMGIAAMIVILTIMNANGTPIEDVDLLFEDNSPTTLFFYALGLLGSTLGGYVCGRLAAGRELKAGLVLGAITSALGVLTDVATRSPVLVLATMSVLTIGVTGYGALLAKKRALSTEVGHEDAS